MVEHLVWDQGVACSNRVIPIFSFRICGCSSMVELQPSKLVAWVRFPSPAPYRFKTNTPKGVFLLYGGVWGRRSRAAWVRPSVKASLRMSRSGRASTSTSRCEPQARLLNRDVEYSHHPLHIDLKQTRRRAFFCYIAIHSGSPGFWIFPGATAASKNDDRNNHIKGRV